MTQKQISLNIPTSDNKIIYGELIGGAQQPLIILCHGLTGRHNDRIPFNASVFFAQKGFSTYRFSFYYHKHKARNILECTLKMHAEDLDTVVKFFRTQNYSTIYVIGHSLGGMTVLLSDEKLFDKAVLWDPSHKDSDPFLDSKYNQTSKYYISISGVAYLYGQAMVDNFRNLNIKNYAKQFNKPAYIIGAGNSPLNITNHWYASQIPTVDGLTIIKGADHGFSTEDSQSKLFKVTLKWLRS